ncbi:unnamed protein product [Parnassius apollo]|uniref:(apollo) hypothetical protein n=1 Tax=Parnassius apollo TaxID=110799 RepID=A0A8S3XXP7_PARAO|nr:unnamed protein product [Parnassius apollo]
MKILVTLSAVLALTFALPQRRVSLRPGLNEQQTNEENYEYKTEYVQSEYRPLKPIEDFRSKDQDLETSTVIPIISFDKEQESDGSYKTSYETGNHIYAEEQGYFKAIGEDKDALVQQGSYSYTAPDGQVINVEYTADELGFRVKGDHIPTPPPVSPEIQKGLDLIYAGIQANKERAEIEARNNPEAAKQQEEKAALDYKGLYYEQ